MELMIIRPEDREITDRERFRQICDFVQQNLSANDHAEIIETVGDFTEQLEGGCLQHRTILFEICLGRSGINMELCSMLRQIRLHPGCLRHSIAGLIVDGQQETFTKDTARLLAVVVNDAGCWLIGRPLAEGTGSLLNYRATAQKRGCSLMEAYQYSASDLAERLLHFKKPVSLAPEILCLHSSNYTTSNTLRLWDMVKRRLDSRIYVRELSLRDGAVRDCAGCSFSTCMYYSEKSSCYYGGTIVEDVYPALSHCNALMLLCPNYNDALGANLTAAINRLTALYRRKPFSDKLLFALIVSGYSGGDILEQQIIDALNMNKSFLLPGNFALLETAGSPHAIDRVGDIDEQAAQFAQHIQNCLMKEAY